jgi:hypothetical protein
LPPELKKPLFINTFLTLSVVDGRVVI